MNTLIIAAMAVSAPLYTTFVGTNIVYTSDTRPMVVRNLIRPKNKGDRVRTVSRLVDYGKTVYGPVTNTMIRVIPSNKIKKGN